MFSSMASQSTASCAMPMRKRPPEASIPPRVILQSGCGFNWVAEPGMASSSSLQTRSPRPTSRRSAAILLTPPNPASVPAVSTTAWDGTSAKTRLGHTQLSHSGAFFLGAATAIYMVPEEHLAVLALSNSMPIGLPEAICLHFLDLVHHGKAQREYLPLLGNLFSKMIAETDDASKNYATFTPPQYPNSFQGTQHLRRQILERVFRHTGNIGRGESAHLATSAAGKVLRTLSLGRRHFHLLLRQ